jgi:protein-S-isoprenylcysteine O-methyltransferase Ste14
MTELALKAVLGLAALVIVLGIAIFVPAGTLAYWQGWLYLLVFVGSATVITMYLWQNDPQLLQRRVNAGPTAEQQTSQQIIQVLAALSFVAIFVVSGLDHRFGWSQVPLALVILGDALVLAGLFAVFLVFRENSFSSATVEVAAEQRVISTGPYAIVRHPMYAGAFVMLLGTPPALGSWWGLLPALLLMLVIVWRLLDEERLLARELPGYPDYMKSVRYRLVPGLW